MKINYTS